LSSSSRTDLSPSTVEDKTTAFLRKTFREFYFKHHDGVEAPTKIASREFGYTPFGRGMVRHLSYKSMGELAADLVKQAPSSVFCSNATYSEPTLPMDDKGWQGAELIFDIDANDIATSCRSKHSFWSCRDCGKIARSLERPERCSRCQGANMTQLHWSCPVCLDAAKQHTLRLTHFLMEDFGDPHEGIAIYFSGNRGFHIHVSDTRFEEMDPAARTEVANYIKGTGLVRPVESEGGGWRGRIASAGDDQKLSQVVDASASRIDESVTTDIHRIFRMPGTLHGNSGLLKMRIHDLKSFRPDEDPVVLGDEEVVLHVTGSPAFSLRGVTYGPYSSEEATVPTYAAVYMMTKGLARLGE